MKHHETVTLTEQPCPHGLQHSENGEEVQSSVDALEAIWFAQTAGYLLHKQRAEHHHHHQTKGVVDQHNGVSEDQEKVLLKEYK